MDSTPNRPYSRKYTADEAKALSRHERRRLGKMNGFKITGTNRPFIKTEPTSSLADLIK
jgi:hypothetical protein